MRNFHPSLRNQGGIPLHILKSGGALRASSRLPSSSSLLSHRPKKMPIKIENKVHEAPKKQRSLKPLKFKL